MDRQNLESMNGPTIYDSGAVTRRITPLRFKSREKRPNLSQSPHHYATAGSLVMQRSHFSP